MTSDKHDIAVGTCVTCVLNMCAGLAFASGTSSQLEAVSACGGQTISQRGATVVEVVVRKPARNSITITTIIVVITVIIVITTTTIIVSNTITITSTLTTGRCRFHARAAFLSYLPLELPRAAG